MTTANAQCLCGNITLQATLPSKWVAHCHCSLCRRARRRIRDLDRHGSVALFDQILDNSCAGTQSTPGAERGFCSHCGSMLFFRSVKWPGELHIALAHFTTPVDRAPQAHVHWDDHVPWADVDPNDGLPRKSPAQTPSE